MSKEKQIETIKCGDILSDLKKEVHNKAIYPNMLAVSPFISLKAFDAILQNFMKKYATKGGAE